MNKMSRRLGFAIAFAALLTLLICATMLSIGAETPVCEEHDFAVATCTSPKTCTVCGATEGEALGHDFAPATCVSPKTCRVKSCNATEGTPNGHNFAAATCTSPKTCTVCTATQGKAAGHNFVAATCTDAAYCSKCNVKSGEPTGHNFVAATCSAPKTCTVCALTEGTALGHEWNEVNCAAQSNCKRCGAHGAYGAHADADEDKYCDVCGIATDESTAPLKVFVRDYTARVWTIIILSFVGLVALFALYWFVLRVQVPKLWRKIINYVENL